MYYLMDAAGKIRPSETKGLFGGHKKLKIYGKLDCPSALRYIRKGQYVSQRVFFKDEITAMAAGYRPCGICMKEHYRLWREGRLMTHALHITPDLNDERICTVQLADDSERSLPTEALELTGIREQLQNGIEYYDMHIFEDYCIILLEDDKFQWGYTVVWDYVKDKIVHLTNTPYAVCSIVQGDQVVDMYLVQYWGHPADLWYSTAPLDLINPEYEPDKIPLHIPIDASVTKETDCRICAEKEGLVFQAGEQKEIVKTEDP